MDADSAEHYQRELLKRCCDRDAHFVIATCWRRKFLKRLNTLAFGPFRGLIKRKIGADNYDFLTCIATYANYRHGVNTETHIRRLFGRQDVLRREYEHHLTHSAAGCLSSTFDNALSVVVDGLGEATSVKIYHFHEGEHTLLSRKSSSGSLGQFYGLLCELCGFDPLAGKEWKVMGLAAYGERDERYHALLRDLLVVDGLTLREGKHSRQALARLWPLRRLPDQPALDFANLAHTGQLVFNEFMNELLRNAYSYGGFRQSGALRRLRSELGLCRLARSRSAVQE